MINEKIREIKWKWRVGIKENKSMLNFDDCGDALNYYNELVNRNKNTDTKICVYFIKQEGNFNDDDVVENIIHKWYIPLSKN